MVLCYGVTLHVCTDLNDYTFGKYWLISAPSLSLFESSARSSVGCESNCMRLATRLNCCDLMDDAESFETSRWGEAFYKELTETYR